MSRARLDLAVIPGDGIGPEVTAEAVRLLAQVCRMEGVELTVASYDFGAERYLATGETLPEGALEELAGHDAILAGALGDPRVPDQRHAADILLGLRRGLDLYANLRPVRLLDPAHSPLKGRSPEEVAITVVRENTEGLYCGVGGTLRAGTPDEIAVQESIDTRRGVERLVRFAFDHARRRGRQRVCLVDKSNVLVHGHGLWRRVFTEVAAAYPEIESEALYADAAAMLLVTDPVRFQVIVADNFLGDLFSDLAAALAGGLGIAPSANLHPGRTSLFEPVHGSAPDLAGRDLANPAAAVLSAAMLLDEVGLPTGAARLTAAVERTLAAGRTTPDLGGRLGTRAAGAAIAAELARS